MPTELVKPSSDVPWLAVLIPSHNGERWLAAALQSVADQSDHGIEVILIDSSTTSASVNIARSFAGRLDIRIERRTDLVPWQAKTNAAAAMARAAWLCMLHQDDLWLPGRAAALRRWIADEPDVIMHLHAAYIVDGECRHLGVWRCPLPSGGPPLGQRGLLDRLLVQNFVAIPTPAFRRDTYLVTGGLDEQLWYTADWDLYLKLTGQGAIRYHDAILAGFRIHAGSLTVSGSRSLDDFRSQMAIVVHRHLGRLGTQQEPTRRLAAASIEMNIALAAAGQGRPTPLLRAITILLRLGPRQLCRYLTYSRLFERLWPRLRARLTRAL